MRPLASLPNEIILEIASYLPGRDINRFMRSNRHLHILLRPALHASIPANDILIWGASYNDLGAVLLALKHNADINTKTHRQQTALCIAAVKGFTPIVDALLTRPNININQHPSHRRALGDVVQKGDLEMTRHLLHAGFLVYQKRERDPPIASAVMRRDNAMIALLLDTQSGWKSDDMSQANSKTMLDAMEGGYMTVSILELLVKWSSEVLKEGDGKRGLFGRAKIDLKFKGYDKIKAFMDHYGAPYELVGLNEQESTEGSTSAEELASTE